MIVKFKETECKYEDIEREYENDIYSPSYSNVIEVLDTFSERDRQILILYAELRSTRKVGALVGISHTKVNYMLRDLRKEFKERLCGC